MELVSDSVLQDAIQTIERLTAERDRLRETVAELVEAAESGLQALNAHIDDAAKATGLHRDELCPCGQNEVSLLRAAIAKAETSKQDS